MRRRPPFHASHARSKRPSSPLSKKKKKNYRTGTKTVPEKSGPRADESPDLSISCFRSEYCEFLEIAAGRIGGRKGWF